MKGYVGMYENSILCTIKEETEKNQEREIVFDRHNSSGLLKKIAQGSFYTFKC